MLSNRIGHALNTLEAPMTEVCAEFPARRVLVKCPGCRRAIDEEKLRDNLEVCPRCGKHLRVSGRARMRMTVDAGSFEEWDAALRATDFLGFSRLLREARFRARGVGRERRRRLRARAHRRPGVRALLHGRRLHDGVYGLRCR